eukprot:2557876-Amphidinium_carterae.1
MLGDRVWGEDRPVPQEWMSSHASQNALTELRSEGVCAQRSVELPEHAAGGVQVIPMLLGGRVLGGLFRADTRDMRCSSTFRDAHCVSCFQIQVSRQVRPSLIKSPPVQA